ncbi:MAG: hypothetical protein ACHP7A_07410 [Caulobacterales bacterium]
MSETCDLGALYLSLQAEGHEVRVAVSEPLADGTMRGLVPRTADWRAELDWVREAGDDAVVLFESVSEGFGAVQDELRRTGLRVVGGSAFGDRLENDRAYAQALLAELGFPQGHVWEFAGAREAAAFVAERPGRYVLKRSGAGHAAGDTYIGEVSDGRDVAAILRTMGSSHEPLVLMAFLEGVEMGVGAYFNGAEFILPACLDWEHKRFFAGDMGEMTGEMGTVVTFQDTDRFFDATLAKVADRLRAAGHVGYVNLNTIVNEAGIWPLEFTCRFGYPGYSILAPLQVTPWSQLLRAMATGTATRLQTAPGYGVGVVVSTPPFPYSRKQVESPIGLPVLIEPDAERRHFHFGEVGLDEHGQLVTSGLYGWTMVVTGVGPTVPSARRAAYGNTAKIFAPNARYRLDIGERLMSRDMERLRRLGHILAGEH